jgi:hypothetical protein
LNSERTKDPDFNLDMDKNLNTDSNQDMDINLDTDNNQDSDINPDVKPALRVFVYEGCDEKTLRQKGLNFSDIDPRNLASKYDIIFMSLKTLTKEFYQANLDTQPSSEKRISRCHDMNLASGSGLVVGGSKVYVTYPPPIMCIRFEVIVVDETQKIESEGSNQVPTYIFIYIYCAYIYIF